MNVKTAYSFLGNEYKSFSDKPDQETKVEVLTKEIILDNYPNPFNPETTVKYSIQDAGNVEISIHNILGQKIKTIVNQFKNKGTYEVKWDGKNSIGDKASSGLYFYRLIINGKVMDTKKMLMLK